MYYFRGILILKASYNLADVFERYLLSKRQLLLFYPLCTLALLSFT